MLVYLVILEDECGVLGIFSTREKAEKYLNRNTDYWRRKRNNDLCIKEYEIDDVDYD